MNKVVLLSDKEQLPKGASEFACMLNEQGRILLSGVFLPEVDYWRSLYYYSYGMVAPIPYDPAINGGVDVVPLAIPQFRKLCQLNGIEYRIRDKEYENIKQELRTETRFADLLLFSNEAFYQHLDDVISEEYTDDALHGAECPVVVVPETFQRPEHIILAYDGSPSSIHAIKQFAYLLPDLAQLDTVLVYVTKNASREIPDLPFLEELTARHFPKLTLLKLDIDPKKYFSTWLSERKASLLVAGAQGRSGFSELFRKSFIRDIVQEHMLPVFIAHR